MVAAFKEYIFDFEDLKLSILCKHCHTEMIIDISESSSKLPDRCIPCKNEFDENFNRALRDFYSAYMTFTNRNADKRSVSARIRVHCELKASE